MADIGTAYVKIAPNMTGIQGKIAGGLRGSGSQFAKQFGSEVSGKSAVIIGAIAGVAQAAVTKAMNLVTSSISSAIKRVDTLNNAQRTFKFMGFEADEAAKATKALTKSILGLPTPLDSAMRGMQSLAATYQDVKLGQKVFSSLNNAILGFGGSAEMVENAIMQLSQLPLDGPLDAQTWNSLRNSGLTPLFVAMAKESKMSVSEMKTAFGEGELKVSDFTEKLIEMNTKGGGGLASLETIAKSATSGIGTGMANMQTAVSRGLANIIQAIGAANIAGAIGKIGSSFEKVLNIIANNVPKAVDALGKFTDFVIRNKDALTSLAVGVATAAVALKTYNSVLKITQSISDAYTGVSLYLNLVHDLQAQGLGLLSAAWTALNASMKANPIGLIITAVTALTAGLVYFFTRTETGRKIFSKFTEYVKVALSGLMVNLKIAGAVVTTVFRGIQKATDVLLSAIKYLVGFWKPAFEGIAAVIDGMWEAYMLMWRSIKSTIEPLVVLIRDRLLGAFIELKNTLAKELQPVIAEFKRFWDATLKPAFEGLARLWYSTLYPALQAFQREFDKIWQQIRGPVLAALKILGGIIAVIAAGPILALIAAVVSVIAIFAVLVYAILKAINWFTKLSGIVWRAMVSIDRAVKDGIANVVSWFVGLPRRIAGALGSLGSTLANAGRDLINGLINGITGRVTRLLDTVKGLAGKISGAFASVLKIFSPSKVFAGYGKNIAEGLAQGISKNAYAVTRSVDKMVDATVSPLTSPLMSPRVAFAASPSSVPAVAGAGPDSATIVQNNSIYNQVDLNSVTRELAWQIRR